MPRLKASKKASVSCFARPAPCQADAMLHYPVESRHLPATALAVSNSCESAACPYVHVKLPSRQHARPPSAACQLLINARSLYSPWAPTQGRLRSMLRPFLRRHPHRRLRLHLRQPPSPPHSHSPFKLSTESGFLAERWIRVLRPRRATDAHPKSGGRTQDSGSGQEVIEPDRTHPRGRPSRTTGQCAISERSFSGNQRRSAASS